MKNNEKVVFLKRWLSNPLRVGAIFPSSQALTKRVCLEIKNPKKAKIVELGGGTGSVTKALLELGVAPKNLAVVELDPVLCKYLEQNFEGINVVQGNARDLDKIVPKGFEKVDYVISGMPLTSLPQEVKRGLIEASFKLLSEDGRFIQYCYNPTLHLSLKSFGIHCNLLGAVWRNFPPAVVWEFTQEGSEAALAG